MFVSNEVEYIFMRKQLLLLSIIFTLFFTLFSYTVAKEMWQKVDFDTTVKVQDRIPRRVDEYFSIFSILGSAEVTLAICIVMMFLSLIHMKFVPIIGWLIMIPALVGEIFGKLILFHPSPPVFMHRTMLPSNLPQFYIHTNFSYPSGHMMRTVFIASVFILWLLTGKSRIWVKIITIGGILLFIFMMGLTRIYLGEHWLSDVLGGALWGASSGIFASVLILPVKRGIKGVSAPSS